MNKEVVAKHKYARLSPKKAAIVMDLVRGKSLEEAKVILSFDRTKAAKMILKVVKSAEANAVNNNKLDAKNLCISEIYVAPGPTVKRMKAGSKGRSDPILKRYSHIYIKLSSFAKASPKAEKVKKSASTGSVGSPQAGSVQEKIKVKKPAKKEKSR